MYSMVKNGQGQTMMLFQINEITVEQTKDTKIVDD